jgi:hypothetical protein
MRTIRIFITTPTPVDVEISECIQKPPNWKDQLAKLFRQLGAPKQPEKPIENENGGEP